MNTINVTRCDKRNQPNAISFTSVANTTAGQASEYEFTFSGADDRSYIIVMNGGSKNVTAKLSESALCTATENEEYTVSASGSVVIPIESGRCITERGTVVLTIAPKESTDNLTACQVKIAGFVFGHATN